MDTENTRVIGISPAGRNDMFGQQWLFILDDYRIEASP